MTLEEAKVELEKFVKLKTTMRPAFVQPLLDAKEVKHGHWIEANDVSSSPFDAMKRCLCSECREWGVVTNYCPHCGAKMDEVEENG